MKSFGRSDRASHARTGERCRGRRAVPGDRDLSRPRQRRSPGLARIQVGAAVHLHLRLAESAQHLGRQDLLDEQVLPEHHGLARSRPDGPEQRDRLRRPVVPRVDGRDEGLHVRDSPHRGVVSVRPVEPERRPPVVQDQRDPFAARRAPREERRGMFDARRADTTPARCREAWPNHPFRSGPERYTDPGRSGAGSRCATGTTTTGCRAAARSGRRHPPRRRPSGRRAPRRTASGTAPRTRPWPSCLARVPTHGTRNLGVLRCAGDLPRRADHPVRRVLVRPPGRRADRGPHAGLLPDHRTVRGRLPLRRGRRGRPASGRGGAGRPDRRRRAWTSRSARRKP